jgi:hypothetical protein
MVWAAAYCHCLCSSVSSQGANFAEIYLPLEFASLFHTRSLKCTLSVFVGDFAKFPHVLKGGTN